MCTENGLILTSVAPEVINASTVLCIETVAILEAHKLNKKIFIALTGYESAIIRTGAGAAATCS
ncbi:hypothetical protein GCM10020370_62740 [Paenibacillus hodogayensis]